MFAPSRSRRHALAAAVFASGVALLQAGPARAHIDLLQPEARAHGTAARGDTQIDENSNLKSGPCGQVASGRTERVATYAPGQTITVRVREENAHVSYLRVALALDGESFPLRSAVPAAPETQEEASAAERALGDFGLLAVVRENNDTAGFVHEIEVTLPETPCERCTLQVLQFMYDDPAAPYYFQCADLVLAANGPADAGTTAEPAPAGSDGSGASSGGSSSATGSGGASAASGAAGPGALSGAPGGSASAPGAGNTAAPASSRPASSATPVAEAASGAESSDAGGSGCGLVAPTSAGARATAALGLLALAFAAQRRRR